MRSGCPQVRTGTGHSWAALRAPLGHSQPGVCSPALVLSAAICESLVSPELVLVVGGACWVCLVQYVTCE